MKFIKDKVTILSLIAMLLLYAILGLTIYFTYNSEVITSFASFVNYYFYYLKGPEYIVLSVVLLGTVIVYILATFIVIGTQRDSKIREILIKENKIIHTGFYGPLNKVVDKYFRGIYNILAIMGILGILLSEILLFAVYSIIVANIVESFTTKIFVVLPLMILVILVSYTWFNKFISYVFNNGILPVFRDVEQPYRYLSESDESKIKGWSIIVGALFTVFTVIITVLGIVDTNLLTELDKNGDLRFLLFLLSVGFITTALRASKGLLRVI